jgi:16S rRNA (guanine966-N2)-methyltransferase
LSRGVVRISGGIWRGRTLPVFERTGLRPTAARVRATLFNWLRPVLQGARCLDLYAGTGILGFEAVSEGAAAAVLVEADRSIAMQIEANAVRLGTSAVAAITMSVDRFLAEAPTPYPIIFVDPPYAADLLPSTLNLLARGWVAPEGLVYVENNRPLPQDVWHERGWEFWKYARAGQVHYYLLRRAACPAALT